MISLRRRKAFFAAVAAVAFCSWAGAAPPDADAGSKAAYSVTASGGTGGGVAAGSRPSSSIALPVTPSPAPGAGNIGVSIIFYLMVLALLAAVAVYMVRSGWPSSLLGKKASHKLQVAEIRSLGNRQFLVVAEYEATRILLGVSHGRIDLLCHLGRDPLEGEDFAHLVREAPPESKS